MTFLGKTMVFFILIVSLTGLGVAVWVAIDARDWKAELDAIEKQIRERDQARQREEGALRDLIVEINSGGRLMPWDPEATMADAPQAAQAQTVRQTRDGNKKLLAENQQKLDQANALQTRLLFALDLVTKARSETEAAEAEQLRLREEITPDPVKEPNRQPFKVMVDEQRVVQKRSQDESVRYKTGVKQNPDNYPGEINELVNLAQLRKRNAELKKRVAEFKAKTATTSAR